MPTPLLTDEDLWAEAWLDRNYGGAPDECSVCYINHGWIVKTTNCLIHP